MPLTSEIAKSVFKYSAFRNKHKQIAIEDGNNEKKHEGMQKQRIENIGNF